MNWDTDRSRPAAASSSPVTPRTTRATSRRFLPIAATSIHAAINGLIPRGAARRGYRPHFLRRAGSFSILGHFDRQCHHRQQSPAPVPSLISCWNLGTVRALTGVVPQRSGVEFDIDSGHRRSRKVVAALTADELASTIRDFTPSRPTEITDGSPQGRPRAWQSSWAPSRIRQREHFGRTRLRVSSLRRSPFSAVNRLQSSCGFLPG